MALSFLAAVGAASALVSASPLDSPSSFQDSASDRWQAVTTPNGPRVYLDRSSIRATGPELRRAELAVTKDGAIDKIVGVEISCDVSKWALYLIKEYEPDGALVLTLDLENDRKPGPIKPDTWLDNARQTLCA